MRFFIDKAIVLLLCLIIFFGRFPDLLLTIAALLSSFSVCCLQLTITKRRLMLILTAFYFLLSFFCPSFYLFFPAIAYELFSLKKENLLPLFAIMLLTALILYPEQIFLFCLLYAVSLWLKKQSELLEKISKEIIKLRDTSVECQLLLEQKNRAILENQNAQIYTATLQERNRIAREIHDNVGHLLTRSILQVGALKTINQDSLLSPHFDSLQSTLDQAMTSIRNSVHDLHDESIDLKSAIENLLKNIQSFDINFDYSMSKETPKELKYTFLSIIKEALNNTVKHSNGDKISLTLCEHPAFYQLLIEDNGTNISKNNPAGIGLLNMQERIAALSGVFQIKTDNGFHIFISIMKGTANENYYCGR